MDFKRMLYFCTIVEQGQICRAAKVLNISQSPLSQRLKELEEEVGKPLIIRNGGQWAITAEGVALYKGAQSILSQMNKLVQDVQNASEELKGEVLIGVSARCLSFFMQILPRLSQEYPNITCRVVVIDSPSLERALQQREIDFAIMLLPTTDDCIEVLPLPQQHFVAVYSRLLPLPPAGPLPLGELVKYPLLIPRRWTDSGGARPLILAFQKQGLKPRILLDTHASYILLGALYTTPAIAIMHNTEIPPEHTNFFSIRTIDLPEITFNPAITYLKDTYLTTQAQVVIHLIQMHSSSAQDSTAQARSSETSATL